MYLIDTHSHLLSREFFTRNDVEKIIEECERQSIIILESLLEPEKYAENLKIIEKYSNVFATLGFLKPEASEEEIKNAIELMKKFVKHPKVVGIGETGMDFFKGTDHEKQKKNFRLLLGFAQETVSPVVVHSRSAGKYCFDILKEFEIKNVIFHCFDGNIKLAKKIVENGWFISIPTNVCYNSMAQRYVKEIPLENLVLETDSPFLHPLQKKDEKNTPLNLKFSVKKISEITGKSEEMVVEITSENAQRIFKFKYPLE